MIGGLALMMYRCRGRFLSNSVIGVKTAITKTMEDILIRGSAPKALHLRHEFAQFA